MIGQLRLLNTIDNQIATNSFPRFIILVGPEGSGKKLLASYIASKIGGFEVVASDVKVATIKELINQAYRVSNSTVYIIPDADDMSLAAKNVLLKVTEEPPNRTFWIMTLESLNNTLPTIRSRGFVYMMNPYSLNELAEYLSKKYLIDKSDPRYKIVLELAETPGDIDSLMAADPVPFYRYVQQVVDNIAEVSGANAFKISKRLSLKKDSDGYDLSLFWKAFSSVCYHNMMSDSYRYSKGIQITTKYANDLGIRGINKESLVDAWILDIRQEWMD